MTDSSSTATQPAKSGTLRSWISPIIGSILLLLPLATSIQAWLGDSPGKIWVATLAVIALVIGVIAWRFRRGLVIWCGLIASAVLIVVPAYLYGVAGAQLPIAGVPFSLFVPALFLVGLALAAWELARLPRLPLWARFIAPALALFAAVPVVMGLMEGVPFVEVLVGLWTLPYWTQGAWFGGAVFIPIALIVSLLRAIIPAWRTEPFRKSIALTSIAVFVAVTLATGFTMTTRDLMHPMAFVPVPAYSAKAEQETGYDKSASARPAEASLAATAEPATQPKSLATADAVGKPLDSAIGTNGLAAEHTTTQGGAEQLWLPLETAIAEIPRDRFDPAAVIAQVGTDPEALFAWVRDETVLLPYCGALKGAGGVLLDRGGNALDRALLLRELLVQAGHRARLAHAELTPDQTAVLVAALGRLVPATSATVTDPTKLADRAAAELGLDASAVSAQLDRAERAGADLQATLAARTERHSKAILEALGSTPSPGLDVASFLADHWWVLLERRGAKPLDLDPSLASAKAGDHLVDSTRSLNLKSLAQLAKVGGACGDRLHSVRVRAVAEVSDGKKLVEHVLLDHELLPIDLAGRSLTLSFISHGGPQAPDPFSQTAPAAGLLAALVQDNEWQPLLTIDKEQVTGKAVTDTGEVRKQPGRAKSTGGALGGFGGGLSGGGDSGGSSGRFTAFWWTFEVSTPGVGTVTERRQVFDLIGPAARAAGATGKTEFDEEARTSRALALAGQTELAALSAAPTTDLLNFVAASRLLAERNAWQALYDQGKTLPMAAMNERLNAVGALRTPLERFALERGRFSAATGRGPQVGLMVLAHHRRLRTDLSTDQAFDLIATAPRVARQHSFNARLRDSVTDTNLEALLASSKKSRPESLAVADAFDRAPGSWRIVRQANDIDDSVLSADLAARVAEDLAAGFIALVPSDTRDAVGWWRIDPATGATLGVGSRGWGQGMAGYSERVSVLLQVRGVINQYGAMGQCLVLAVTQPLRGVEGVDDELAKCIFSLVCGAINDALSGQVEGPPTWFNVIIMATIAELWGGTPEAGTGGMCGGLWEKLN